MVPMAGPVRAIIAELHLNDSDCLYLLTGYGTGFVVVAENCPSACHDYDDLIHTQMDMDILVKLP